MILRSARSPFEANVDNNFFVFSGMIAQMPSPHRGIFTLVGVDFAIAFSFRSPAFGRSVVAFYVCAFVGTKGTYIHTLCANWIGATRSM